MCRDYSLGRITFNVFFFVTRKGPRAVPIPFGSLLVSFVDAVALLSPSQCSGATKEQDLPGARLLEAFAGFDRGHQSLYLRSGGFPALLKVHQQGKGRGKRAKDRARQEATSGLGLLAAWRIALPKFSRPCCPTSLQRIKSVSLAARRNRGKNEWAQRIASACSLM